MISFLACCLLGQMQSPSMGDGPPVQREMDGVISAVVKPNVVSIAAIGAKAPMKVRFYGVNANNLPRKIADEGIALLNSTTKNRRVKFEVLKWDKDGTPVGRLMCRKGVEESSNWINVGPLLLSKGLLRWDEKEAPKDRLLARVQKSAKDQKRGLWAAPH